MKKWSFRVLACVVMSLCVILLTACNNEAEALQERIDALETENAELQGTITSLRTDLERSQANFAGAQGELQSLQASIAAAAAAEEQGDSGVQSGALAITYAGQANTDMSWPLSYGELNLGLRLNPDDLAGGAEIVWRSTNEEVFTVVPGEDGTSAVATPESTGSAEMVVTVGGQETRSWIRIT